MIERRTRVILWALVVVLLAWGLTLAGYRVALNSRMTVEKVTAFLNANDLSHLSTAERAEALRALASRLNALTLEERRRARQEAQWQAWIEQMTDAEKEKLIAATFPAGIKQMMTAFEQLSGPQRQRMVDDALKRLKTTGELTVGDDTFLRRGEQKQPGAEMNPKLVERIHEVGLKTFFAESSAQMKVEAAPLLEEIQRQMQSGGWGRNRDR